MHENKGADCYCISMRRAANAVTKLYDDRFKEAGLTVGQYSILNNLSKLQTATVTELANVLRLERTTVTRNLKPLLGAGFIQDMAGHDKRDRAITLTEEGKQALKTGRDCWEKTQAFVETAIGKEEMDRFLKMLQLLEHIEAQA